LETIFIGGGTPTLLAPALWRVLFNSIRSSLPLASDFGRRTEFTVEANPETVTDELAGILASGGVNRVSIGCQSFNPVHLRSLERWHDPRNVHRSVGILRAAGIDNVNLDLIFAIPGQTLDEWLADLEEALSLEPTHLSCYGLVYEPNTPLTVKMKAGKLEPVDQELEGEMYAASIERLKAAGFEHYEISNWARLASPSGGPAPTLAGNGSPCRCHHNLLYWMNANWWPFGPSASGHVNGLRWKNVPRLGEYLDHGPLPSITDVERLDDDGRIGEAFMLGLRLIEGMPLDRVRHLLAHGRRRALRAAAIERHIAAGLLERGPDRLWLRASGLMLADSVLADLL
jgi:oxygen-independent coproporphyrinogen-3 oxidase